MEEIYFDKTDAEQVEMLAKELTNLEGRTITSVSANSMVADGTGELVIDIRCGELVAVTLIGREVLISAEKHVFRIKR